MATPATKTAAVTTNREDFGPGSVMPHGFFFYAVGQVVEGAIAVHVSLAKASLTMMQATTPKAKITAGLAGGKLLLQPGWHQPVPGSTLVGLKRYVHRRVRAVEG